MKPKILIVAFEVGDEKEEEFLAELFSGEVMRAIPSIRLGQREGRIFEHDERGPVAAIDLRQHDTFKAISVVIGPLGSLLDPSGWMDTQHHRYRSRRTAQSALRGAPSAGVELLRKKGHISVMYPQCIKPLMGKSGHATVVRPMNWRK